MELGIEAVALLAAVAFVAGMIDAVAGGGGLLTIPALLAAGIPPVAALATNKLQSTVGTAGAVAVFARKGHIDFKRFAGPTLASFLGSAGGAFVLTKIDSRFLSGFIPVLLVAMAVYFLLGPKLSEVDRHDRLGVPLLILVACAIGGYDGFFGPGTGSFFTTALIAICGLGLIRAVAHAKLLNLASNAAGLGVLLAGGHVLWATGLVMALANVAGGQVGAHATIRFGAGAARPLLIIMSLALTAKLLADPTNPITARLLSWFCQ